MNELSKALQTPAATVMEVVTIAKRFEEERDTARSVNAVLMREIDALQQDLRDAAEREKTLRAERDDARKERDILRKRRDKAYHDSIVANKQEAKRQREKAKGIMTKGTCVVMAGLWLFVIGSKAVGWIRYWMGL